MSLIRNIRIGMSADSKGFVKPMADVTSSLDKFNSTANKTKSSVGGMNFGVAGAAMGAGFAAVGVGMKAVGALGGFFADGISSAMDLGETINKTSEVFGGSTDEITKQAEDLAKSFGLPKGAILDAASSFGLLGQGAGQSQKQAASMAKTMTQLSADASSFYNVPMDVAMEKIRSGLSGEAEPLKAFGILMNEDAVKAEGLAMGLVKSGQGMNEQAKMAARASLIQKGLTKSSGDLERTQGGAANQWRKLTGGLSNFATSIGELFLPALTKGMQWLNKFTTSIVQSFEDNKPMIQSWIDWFQSGFDSLVGFVMDIWEPIGEFYSEEFKLYMSIFQWFMDGAKALFEQFKPTIDSWVEYFKSGIRAATVVIRNIGDYWEIAKISATQQIVNLLSVIETIPANLGLIAEYIAGNWKELIVDAINVVITYFVNYGTNVKNLFVATQNFLSGKGFHFEFTPILEGFQSTAAKLPELIKPALVDMSGEIGKIYDSIAEKETALEKTKAEEIAKAKVKAAADAAKGPAAKVDEQVPLGGGPKDEKEKKSKKAEHAGALEMGSTEAYSAIAKYRMGSGEDKAAKDTARNTGEMNNGIKKVVDLMGKQGAGAAGPALAKI